ncbi:MAG TPA: hypothetical protein VL147_10600 [Devosia sp.]|nr:hypothetical protein [Devosia sp.]
MKNVNRMSTTPVKYPRSKRNQAIGKITSVQPGVCAVIASIPMFRGDALKSTRVGFSIEMAETKDRIANKVRARVTAYLVPWLAFERFNGSRDEMDRSYAGEQGLGGTVVPFIDTAVAGAHGTSLFHKTQGLHLDPGVSYNTMYLEAANIVWNFRAKQRSPKIAQRLRLDDTPLPAFWGAGRFEHLVSDFDSASMDGQVALNVVDARMPVRGIAKASSIWEPGTTGPVFDSGGETVNYEGYSPVDGSVPNRVFYVKKAEGTGYPDVWAELEQNGITVSLANIEMAKKAQAFAAMRSKYEGHDDDYIIDTYLMNGLRIPDQALKQPMLIADQTVAFSQAQRHATDSGHLDEKAVSGFAEGSITLRCPALDVGGIVIVQVEILPDQLWERSPDPFLHATSVAEFPEAMRDFADPEKVYFVTNGEIDADHSDPDGLFGFAPLNWKWNAFGPGIGGKFFKPAAGGGTNVLRQRFWAHEEVDPSLSENFYLCKGLTTSIFLDETSDPFELTLQGNAVLDGLTQFGRALIEATDNYEKVMENMDQTRVKEA